MDTNMNTDTDMDMDTDMTTASDTDMDMVFDSLDSEFLNKANVGHTSFLPSPLPNPTHL